MLAVRSALIDNMYGWPDWVLMIPWRHNPLHLSPTRKPTFRVIRGWANITWGGSGGEDSKPSPILLKHSWGFYSVPLHLIIHWNFTPSFLASAGLSFTLPHPSQFRALLLLVPLRVWKQCYTFTGFVSRLSVQLEQQKVPLARERMEGGLAGLLWSVNGILQSSVSPQWERTVRTLC